MESQFLLCAESKKWMCISELQIDQVSQTVIMLCSNILGEIATILLNKRQFLSYFKSLKILFLPSVPAMPNSTDVLLVCQAAVF